jgi:hypothetical protein
MCYPDADLTPEPAPVWPFWLLGIATVLAAACYALSVYLNAQWEQDTSDAHADGYTQGMIAGSRAMRDAAETLSITQYERGMQDGLQQQGCRAQKGAL